MIYRQVVALLIKKIIITVLLISFFSFSVNSLQDEHISARAAVVIDNDTNMVVYEKNMTERLSMASTTKIMTAILAIESGKLFCTVTAERDIICEGTSIGIKKGDSFTLETLVWAVLLESGNDASILIAEYLADNEASFAGLMNKKAVSIGMNNTNFVTASGLDADEHYTTAYDMALLASYAIKNPIFKNMCSSEHYKAEYISPDISKTYNNHNKLLKMYSGVFGVKTGFTKKSGRCLVSACERDGSSFIIVTLNAPDDWNDHIKLYDYCFGISKKINKDIMVPHRLRVYGSDVEWITLSYDEATVNSLISENVTCILLLPEFVYAPIMSNDQIGKIIFFLNGVKYKEVSVCAALQVSTIGGKMKPTYTLLDKLTSFFN